MIEEEPDRLIEVEGIGPKRVGMIKRAWEEQKEIKNVMLFLQSHGVSTSFAVKIYKAYGNKSIEVVKQNPYRLADEIWGIGFRTADKIAQKMGFDKDSYERCRAGIIYVLNELSNEGHCYATREQLVEESVKILEQSEENIQEAVEQMLAAKALILDFEDAIYLPPFYFSEVGVAKLVSRLNTVQEQKDYGKIMAKVQKDCGIVYDEIQEAAIKTALMAPFMVLTGGPGTGKTTTTLGIIQAFLSMGKKGIAGCPHGQSGQTDDGGYRFGGQNYSPAAGILTGGRV